MYPEIKWYDYIYLTLYELICYQTTKFLNFPKRQNLVSFKLNDFADDNFKHDGNGGKFSEKVENTVGKGEIARYEQLLFFP